MKSIVSGILGCVLVLCFSALASAATCTAPGHPSCTITCPDGCGALYHEPNGPCRTFCSSAAKAEKEKSSTSVEANDLSPAEVEKLIKGEK
jgi:hypothetical protein